jgi:hypothetical protein
MFIVSSWTLAVVALSQLLLLPAFAAQQLVTTKTLIVKNPPSGARKVLWKVKEAAATVVGNPITEGGATLRIQLTPGGDQCVTMPASGWSAIGTIGFKYKDATLTNGPVKVAQIKKTPSGTFLVKALLKTGGPASIAITPGNPTASYATNFSLGTGDEYCGGTSTATPNPNDANTFKVSNDGAPGFSCIASCNGMTTSTLPATTTSTLDCGTPSCEPTTTSTSVTTTSSTTSTLGCGTPPCPATPVITASNPLTSPSARSSDNTPDLIGTATSGNTVEIYGNSGCSGAPVAGGTASGGSFTIGVTVADNSTTTFTARASDGIFSSGCSAPFFYYHDASVPSVSITSTTPSTSPGAPSADRTPVINGTTDPLASSIKIYATSDCTGSIYGAGAPVGGMFSIPTGTDTVAMGQTLYTAETTVGASTACSNYIAYYTAP